MQCTGLQVFSAVLLLIGTVLVIVSIATNFWSYYEYDDRRFGISTLQKGRRGLWEQCDIQTFRENKISSELGLNIQSSHIKETCRNRYTKLIDSVTEGSFDESTYSKFSIWEVSCLTLMVCSALVGLVAFLTSPFSCSRCPYCLAVWVFLAALNAIAGIAVYVYFQQTGQIVTINNDVTQTPLSTIVVKPAGYGYSFYCGIAGAACQLISSILFYASRVRSYTYSYIT